MKAQTLLRLGALVAAVAFTSGAARADEEEGTSTTRIKFSDPAKPGTLKADLPWADLHVTGTNGNEVVVTSTLNQHGKKEERPDGLRRLDEDVSFDLLEKNNVVSISIFGETSWAQPGAEFKIEVPHNTSLVLRTQSGGDLTVENIDGDIEINSMNGEVTLREIGSSAVVNTMNGEINAVFKTAPVKPVSFSSMNGEISLKLPGDTKANLRMRSHNGAILTDFAEGILKTKSENTGHVRSADAPEAPEAAEAPEAPVAPVAAVSVDSQTERDAAHAARDAKRAAERAMRDAQRAVLASAGHNLHFPPLPPFGGKSVVGTLNGGGIDIQLSTMNGAITIRQSK
jgi:uncharacterized protein YuzE